MLRWIALGACALGLATGSGCGNEDLTASPSSTAASTSSTTGGAGGTGGSGAGTGGSTPSVCDEQALPVLPFDVTGPFGIKRHDRADDFVVPLTDGTSWRLSEQWTGCESYLFVTSARTNSALDTSSIWLRDVDKLIAKSPPNAHYFFVAARAQADAAGEIDAMQSRIDAALAKLDAGAAAFWRERLHLVPKHYSELEGWPKDLLGGAGKGGFAIDRAQRVRLLGNFADVTRFKSALQTAGEWPWESNMAYATYEVRHFNWEAKRDAALASEEATVVAAWSGEVLKGVVEKEVTFPDARTMAGFDTLLLDVDMDCPDASKGEFGNCGAWDYLANLFLLAEDGVTWRELGRFITTYHREGHYLVDATGMLPLLAKGGARKLRYVISPDWNQQAYLSRVDFRFSNRKKGYAPSQAVMLWTGADFNSQYNDNFDPIDVDIPEGAKRVELWAIITGHGGATQNCAEFCRHQHEFTINGKSYLKDHETVGSNEGCIAQVDNGMVPNQGGTWWFGRGGWCPGQQVDPFVVDVTKDVTPGMTATLSYKGTLNGKQPPDDAGNIVMTSYLVIHE